MVCSQPEESAHDIVDLTASKQYFSFLNKMLIETKPPSPYPRWDVRLRAVVVDFVLPAMQMEHLALSCREEPHTKACWEESACSFTPSWLDILPSDWLHTRSSLSPPSAGFLSFHESRNIWKQLQCETTGSGWRWHEFRSAFVITITSHEVPWILINTHRFMLRAIGTKTEGCLFYLFPFASLVLPVFTPFFCTYSHPTLVLSYIVLMYCYLLAWFPYCFLLVSLVTSSWR